MMPNMFQNGMGMGGMMGMPIMGMPGMNYPIGQMPVMMPFPEININNQGNVGGNDNWALGYSSVNGGNGGNNQNQANSIQTFGNKFNCIFTTSSGKNITILIDKGKTINDLIKIFFLRVEQPELINRKQDICFLFNATKIDFDSQIKVEDFFKFNLNPRITVNDMGNLIGA